jgi:septal ring factor EnvC (AmiA/AmiB activator)
MGDDLPQGRRAAPLALLLPAIWAAALAAAPARPAEPGAGSARSKEQLARRLADERAAVAQLAQKEGTILGRLSELERQIEIEGRAWRSALARLRIAQSRLDTAAVRVRTAEDRVEKATVAVGPRLLARYRLGREAYIRFLLGSRSISDVLRRKRLYSALLEADAASLGELRFLAVGARAGRDELGAARDDLARSVEAEQERRAALEVRTSTQRKLLVSVQQEKALHLQALRELEEAARALTSHLHELQRADHGHPPAARLPAPTSTPPATPATSAETSGSPAAAASTSTAAEEAPRAAAARPAEPEIRNAKGKLLFPVEAGTVEVRFGRARDPRFGTVTLQRGLDIRAAEGSRVRAVHGGRVAHSGWFKGYGNLVILDHGQGLFSLYAHLGELGRAQGDEVSRGEALGTVGDTGSLKGPYLYFELRDGQTPLDPARWLAQQQRPQAVSTARSQAASTARSQAASTARSQAPSTARK